MRTQITKLAEIFKESGEKELVIGLSDLTSMTYAECEARSLKLARLLEKKGIGKGDKVGIILPNCPEYVVIYFSLMQLGAIAVPINPGLHTSEIEYLIDNSGSKLLFVAAEFRNRLEKILNKMENVEKIHLFDMDIFLELDKGNPLDGHPFSRIEDEDITAIMYTSGTTSQPKGVAICYRNVIANGLVFIDTMKIPAGLRFLGVFSLAYMGGWYNLMFIPVLSRGTVLVDQVFGSNTALNFWDKVVKNKVTALWLTPTMMSILLYTGKAKEAFDYCKKNIKAAFVGTAPLPSKIKKDFENSCGVYFYENYGLSETFFISTDHHGSRHKTSSVGKIIRGCEIEIRDAMGKRCGVSQEGEICVKTEYLMKGYYGESQDSDITDKKGFFRTGDIGYIDSGGDLFITGRKKDLIIRGGLNISPKQIEDVLMEMKEVDEVACVGVPHDIYGEEVAIVVKLKDRYKSTLQEKDIVDYSSRHLSQAKYPRFVYFVDEFPKSSSGKIQKGKLRLMLQERMGNK